MSGIRTHNLISESNHHTIMTTTAPLFIYDPIYISYFQWSVHYIVWGDTEVVIVLWVDFKLSVKPMPITTKIVTSNPVNGEVYTIMW